MSTKPSWYWELRKYYSVDRIDKAISELASRESLWKGFWGGFAVSAIGLALWKAVACLGGLATGLYPLALGLLVSFTIRRLGRGVGVAYSMAGVMCYCGAVFAMVAVLGLDCGASISGYDLSRFASLDEVGFLGVIGGGIVTWHFSRARVSGDAVLLELRKVDTE
jgi:hypothetical protein